MNREGKISELKSWLTKVVNETEEFEFPQTMQFQYRPEEPIYTVTIAREQPDFYVDKHGTKWVRQKTKNG